MSVLGVVCLSAGGVSVQGGGVDGQTPCGQTNARENITFPHTTYAVDKDIL